MVIVSANTPTQEPGGTAVLYVQSAAGTLLMYVSKCCLISLGHISVAALPEIVKGDLQCAGHEYLLKKQWAKNYISNEEGKKSLTNYIAIILTPPKFSRIRAKTTRSERLHFVLVNAKKLLYFIMYEVFLFTDLF